MNKLKFIIVALLIFLFTHTFSSLAYATPYGRDVYGKDLYGGGHSNIAPSNNGGTSGGGSSSNNGSGSSTCTSQSPGSAPNLFQVNTKGTSAIIYFAPSKKPYTNYYVSFGDGASSEGYGTGFELSQSTGALKYDVYQLKPNAFYTFKVRAGNGCRAGAWSSNMTVKSGRKNSKTITKYYPKKQARVPAINNLKINLKKVLAPILH